MKKMFYTMSLCSVFILAAGMASAQGTSGLIAHWPMSGNSGDSSGNGLHGLMIGTVADTGRSNQPNTALRFTGSSYIAVPYDSRFNATKISICATVKQTGFNAGKCQVNQILMRGTPITPGSYGLMSFDNAFDHDCNTMDTTQNVFGMEVSTNMNMATEGMWYYTPAVQTDRWYTIVATYDGSTAYVYVNGVVKSMVSINVPLDSSTEGLFIGMNYMGPGSSYPYPFTGVIDDIRLYGRVLTSSEILTYHNSTALDVPQTQAADKQISVYPNPAKDVLHMRLVQPVQNGQVAIYNSVGQLMLGKEVHGSDIDLSIPAWPSGSYYVRLTTEGRVYHQQFLVQ